ncbi:N-glycosylase/DNA lyase [Cuniculiplasma sp. SKW3]|uniref:N-glycosylase/DNA lyase n=1 Tax=unclassified Cuniculiplasma TaxID=2619706 RepID=UPI003FD5694C
MISERSEWWVEVESLIKSDFSKEVDAKRREFLKFRDESPENIFFELCFCILTANTSAVLGIRMQQELGPDPFINYGREELKDALKSAKYRFYNTRSKYIVSNRWIIEELPVLLNHPDPWSAREFLVNHCMGIGYKEASHFFRNCGVFDFAILDIHIIRLIDPAMAKSGKPLTRRKYYEYEGIIRKKAEEFHIEPGILDLYMWKIASGQLIK